MFIWTHGFVGAAIFYQLFGVDSWYFGFILGTFPDLLDWLFAKFKWTERWSVHRWFSNSALGLITSAILIAPLVHVLFDRFLHAPILPNHGESSYMDEVLFTVPLFGKQVSRLDILWVGLDLQQIFLALWIYSIN